MKEPNPLTKQLAPLIFVIVLIILLTLIIGGSRMPEEPEAGRDSGSKLEMRLSPFSYQPPARNDPVKSAELRLPDPEAVIAAANRDISSGRYSRAEDQLRTALIFYPDDRRIISGMA